MTNNYLDPADQKMQKRWCIMTYINFLSIPLVALNFILFFLFELDNTHLWMIAGVLISGTFWASVIYYLVCKKRSTRLFLLLMILFVITALKNIFEVVEVLKDLDMVWPYYFLVANIAIYIYWFILSIKMYKLNKKISALTPQAQPL